MNSPFASRALVVRWEDTGFPHSGEGAGNGFPKMDLGATCTGLEMARQSPLTLYHGKPVHSDVHRIYRLFQHLQHYVDFSRQNKRVITFDR